ncbi:MAG: helix-turn-helix transcriptional regulator [Gammaproteobacteria bacterium]|nr:helix-turn-helix transcriptional regulator [Gammaproteobacteria bacterium]
MSVSDIDRNPTGLREILEADERYHHKLSDILRQRGRPFLLIIDAQGNLDYSSIPDESPFAEQRNLDKALEQAHQLFVSAHSTAKARTQLLVEKPDEHSSLLMLAGKYYSIRIFPLSCSRLDESAEKVAAVIEPIVKPLSMDVEFDRVKDNWALSKREVDVLRELMSGKTDKQIARAVEVSVETVRAYLKSIRVKVGVATRTAIVHAVHEADSLWHREDIAGRVM